MNRKFRRTAFIFCNIINVFIITFDQFKASLLNKSINFYNLAIIPSTASLLETLPGRINSHANPHSVWLTCKLRNITQYRDGYFTILDGKIPHTMAYIDS